MNTEPRHTLRLLAVGDVVGERAVSDLSRLLGAASARYAPDITVVNGENAAGGRGILPEQIDEIFAAGADVITTGNHILDRDAVIPRLEDSPRVLRPANFPAGDVGVGYCIIPVCGVSVLVMNVSGCVYVAARDGSAFGSPFEAAEQILTREAGRYDLAVVDIHAEATGEKLAFARFFDMNRDERDRRVAAVWGTHTHVPTADARVLPGGVGFISDIGMTGPENGILGIDSDTIIRFTKDHARVKFKVADGETVMNAALFELDARAARAISVRRVKFTMR